MENRYERHLPDTVKELREFRKLGEIEGAMLEEMAAAKEELEKNQWILTAERSGLLRLAGMMEFFGAEAMGTEALRAELLYRWSSRSPYTQFHLMDWLDTCLGEGTYQLKLDRERYQLKLNLELRVKEKLDFLKKHLRKIIPANMLMEISLNANTYGDLAGMTHEQMTELGWTYGEIPLEDLTPYQKK